jgi:hypothetical protein
MRSNGTPQQLFEHSDHNDFVEMDNCLAQPPFSSTMHVTQPPGLHFNRPVLVSPDNNSIAESPYSMQRTNMPYTSYASELHTPNDFLPTSVGSGGSGIIEIPFNGFNSPNYNVIPHTSSDLGMYSQIAPTRFFHEQQLTAIMFSNKYKL